MSYEFSQGEIRRLSNLSRRRWKKARPRVVQPYPFDLQAREKALQEASDVLSSAGVRFWLTGGSLLGAIRENNFIAWDDDVDLDMLEEEFVGVMKELKERLIEAGFVVRLIESNRFPKMAFFKYGQKIALGALRDDGEYRTRPAYKYPARFFNEKEKIDFKGRQFLVPSPPEKFLEHVYGDWQTPKRSDIDEEYYNADHFAGKRGNVVLKNILGKVKRMWGRRENGK